MDHSRPARCVRAAIAIGVLGMATGLVPGCSTPYIGTTASSFLRRVRESHDPNVRYAAYTKLGSPRCYDNDEQMVEAVRLMVENLESEREPIATRAIICRTLGELHKPEARQALLKAVNDPDGVVRAEACRSLGKVGRTEDATVLARIMAADVLGDCRIAAIEGLGELKADDPRINVLLVQSMEHDDPAIRLASLRSLRKTTGKDLGVDPGPWREFVEKDAALQSAKNGKKPETAAGR